MFEDEYTNNMQEAASTSENNAQSIPQNEAALNNTTVEHSTNSTESQRVETETIGSSKQQGDAGYRNYNSQSSPYHQSSPYFGNPGNNGSGSDYSDVKREKKTKKSGGLGTKLAAALLIGIVGGGAFGGTTYGVLKTTGVLDSLSVLREATPEEIENQTPTFPGIGSAVVSDEATAAEETKTETTTATSVSDSHQSSITEVANKVMPAMVSIVNNYTYTAESFSFFGYGQQYSEEASASGTGIIVGETDDEYLIVTNNHVVENANSLEVTFADESVSGANIKGLDSDRDLAIIAVAKSDLSVETKKAISVATLGNSDQLCLGEQVIAIGNALGYGQSVTVGYVSALNREVETEDGITNTFIQTDAAINPGNSGGALLNIDGEVIGINSNKIGGNTIEGMGYAIPISSVIDKIGELCARQTRIKVAEEEVGYIGITLQEVTSTIASRWNMPEGIYVVETTEGGAAEAAGLLTGDIITKFDGDKISSYTDLQNLLQYYAAGTTVSITYQRPEGGSYVEYTTELTLGSKPVTDK